MSFLKKLLKAGERRKGPEEEKSVPDSKIEGQINIRDIQEQLTAATNFPLSELTSTGSGSQNFSIQPVSGFQGILNNINAPHTQFQFPGDFKDPQYIFVQYLYDICVGKGWLKLVDPLEPCVMKKNHKDGSKIHYRYLPPCDNLGEGSFVDLVARYLRAEIAVKVSFPLIHAVLETVRPEDGVIPIDLDHRIQILDSIQEIPFASKYHYCAFIRDEKSFVVWGSTIQQVLTFLNQIEKRLINFVWDAGNAVNEKRTNYIPRVTFVNGLDSSDEETSSAKRNSVQAETEAVSGSTTSEESNSTAEFDIENQYEERPIFFVHSVIIALAVIVLMAFIGMFVSQLIRIIVTENYWIILVSILYIPVIFLFCGFFATSVVSVFVFILGPVSQLEKNSYSYSVKRSPRLKPKNGVLPHITIQCPVYKEGLSTVLKPTFESVQKAIHTYELQGGSANIFINDDGLQVIPKSDALERIQYYEENGFGYVARPGHNVDGFIRKGRFKKASNMNYCLHISNLVDGKFDEIRGETTSWDPKQESASYLKALELDVQEEGRCWAGGDILLGELILIIDSDTRIPEDCFLDAASEMHACPDVGILQHASGVMMVVNDYWEQMIAWFTELIYFSISYVSASGADTAAFVGHNAFLRWQAIQECAYVDEDDNRVKYWSESHVSEDFELSLKLGALGYIVRLATYHDGGFKEGVSLNVYDELTRWSKYAYGCSEIMFHPLRKWVLGRIFTPLFRSFVRCNISLACKFGIISYMGTYFAIGASLVMVFVNYFIVGYYNWGYYRIYSDSMHIFVAVTVTFSVASQAAYSIARLRVHNKVTVLQVLGELKWVVVMAIFMGGLSWHMFKAIACHLLGINMAWEATAKDIENSNFFQEVPKAIKNYYMMYVCCILMLIAILCLAYAVPYAYQIRGIAPILPLAWSLWSHILSPIVLNPQITTFSW
ncbi:hypothetical protein A9F13_21g00308 [Clavispora lusitaniae]|uniref:Glycosyltransferase 2-like domain-containing protein n=1 Tax=Clavispora lusitaniae TaxID=36911 RepID=A0AA91PVP9_CLALS|nr:hypothetical protein A9F13_21g00308 [Clavispora lusitaniae]